ncbi:hypothetical protein BCR33DRAFT_720484 [Rhizoclosmatium globosum]|uniref:Distal membrane-arm assembly complex protein 1-like domain-containing protein n=1 Tax=Rhizoclosmatium globosum TaxID=329046 RepID=A0A1Y2BVM1_9FUNG|nr:hypothetical protein BCR33DRAFT_720484 [Rhizoclosmatium globosum]|eukprot:ORY38809.1 hypothetical protein BCR33DRAFT_720484 [Rhizoclosmatium globosum]
MTVEKNTTAVRDIDCWPCRLTGGGVMLGVSGYLAYEMRIAHQNGLKLPIKQYPRLHVGLLSGMSLAFGAAGLVRLFW